MGRVERIEASPELISQIQKQIINGYSKSDIIEYISEKSPQINPEKAFEKSIISFHEYENFDSNIKKGFANAAIQNLYQKMIEIGDFSGALSAIKEYSKLNRLYDKEKAVEKNKPRIKKAVDLNFDIDLDYL